MKRDLIYTNNIFLKVIFFFLSIIYLILNRIKFYLFKHNILKKVKIDNTFIVSVGNITAGGTGKTPFVIWLTQRLKKKGLKVGVVFRAYKSKEKEGIVSDGDSMLMDISESGDEPWLIAKKTSVPVAIGKYRAKIAKRLSEQYSLDVVIMDDAFQYWRLIRDLDIVCVDGKEMFYNKKILPLGIMREPIENLDRAHIAVIKRQDQIAGEDEDLKKYFDEDAIFDMSYELSLSERVKESKRILALAGIAKPEGFFNMLRKRLPESKVFGMPFNDHCIYDLDDIKRINMFCKKNMIDSIVCTEKDYFKLVELMDDVECAQLKVNIRGGEDIEERIVNASDNSR